MKNVIIGMAIEDIKTGDTIVFDASNGNVRRATCEDRQTENSIGTVVLSIENNPEYRDHFMETKMVEYQGYRNKDSGQVFIVKADHPMNPAFYEKIGMLSYLEKE